MTNNNKMSERNNAPNDTFEALHASKSLIKGDMLQLAEDDSYEYDEDAEANHDFDLHLPVLDALITSSPSFLPAGSNGSNNLTNLSIGTPSVKSQYYHSATSRIDDDGNETDYDGDNGNMNDLNSEYVSEP